MTKIYPIFFSQSWEDLDVETAKTRGHIDYKLKPKVDDPSRQKFAYLNYMWLSNHIIEPKGRKQMDNEDNQVSLEGILYQPVLWKENAMRYD